MKNIKKQYAALLIIACIASFQLIRSAILNYYEQQRQLELVNSIPNFHSSKEKDILKKMGMDPITPGQVFLHSYNCQGCHGSDSAHYSNIDSNGVDVNLFDDWRATMMANSARDPLWRAKVSHEILVNPAISNQIQNTCTSCHAPMGHYTSLYHGNPFYTISDLVVDSMGLDGVSCSGCHMIGPNGLGTMFSGNIPYDTTHVEFGPFTSPITGPMQLYVGLTPTWSDHVSEGKMCSSCHTLLTGTHDLSGTPTGETFVEQATFHEWVNSTYSGDNVSCQSCHMPHANDSIILANGYFNLPPRFPFNQHKFQGANLFMLKLMKNNRTSLGVQATDANYDSSISATVDFLRNQTLSVDLSVDSVTYDTGFFTVRLTNHAGHKFPSGYPSRRAVLQFVVIGSSNDTLFKSGFFNSNYEVTNIDPVFEPHYDVISNQTQSQIYEMIMGDVNGNKTTVLERADTILKDNRLPPEGFLSTSNVYDTVGIIGNAFTDPNFNKSIVNGNEGTGRDYVHFHVPINGYATPFSVYAYMYYQTLPPGFLTEMFSYSSAAIDTFQSMFNGADKSPFLVAEDSVMGVALGAQIPDLDDLIKVGPSPTSDGVVNIYLPWSVSAFKVSLYEITGRFISTKVHTDQLTTYKSELPQTRGTYIMDLVFDGKHVVRKIVRN
jgi:hypothetical protein